MIPRSLATLLGTSKTSPVHTISKSDGLTTKSVFIALEGKTNGLSGLGVPTAEVQNLKDYLVLLPDKN